MFSKIKTKWLVITLLVLLVLSAIVLIINNSKSTMSRNRTFKSELTDFDSAKVTQIYIYPKLKGETVALSRIGNNWKVTVGSNKYNADPNTIKNMIGTLYGLRAERIATRDKSMWKQYEVTDSAASHVQLTAGKKTVVDIYLGKFSYQQPKNTNPYYYSQQQGKMTSYVRLAGDKAVYAVDGLIAMSFSRQANDFRDRTIIRSNKESWNRLAFTGPDKTFDLVKQDNSWTIDGMPVDSASVAKYLSSLSFLSNSNFMDESVLTADKPLYTLSIEGENIPSPIKVNAFPADTTNKYAIASSMNEGAYFSGGKNGLFDKIFVSREHFYPPNVTTVNKK